MPYDGNARQLANKQKEECICNIWCIYAHTYMRVGTHSRDDGECDRYTPY